MDDRPVNEPLPPGRVVERSFDLLSLDFDPTPSIVPYVEIASRLGKGVRRTRASDERPHRAGVLAGSCSQGHTTASAPASGRLAPSMLGGGREVVNDSTERPPGKLARHQLDVTGRNPSGKMADHRVQGLVGVCDQLPRRWAIPSVSREILPFAQGGDVLAVRPKRARALRCRALAVT